MHAQRRRPLPVTYVLCSAIRRVCVRVKRMPSFSISKRHEYMHWKSGRYTKARHAGNSIHANPPGRPREFCLASFSRPTLRRHAIVPRMRQLPTSPRISIFFLLFFFSSPASTHFGRPKCVSFVAYCSPFFFLCRILFSVLRNEIAYCSPYFVAQYRICGHNKLDLCNSACSDENRTRARSLYLSRARAHGFSLMYN
jgi:hypothetical protein